MGSEMCIRDRACIVLLWGYSRYFQKQILIGNVIVALLTFLSICWLNSFNEVFNPIIYWVGGLSFFIHLIRELVKDIEDVKGDRAFGYRTLAVYWPLLKVKISIWCLILILLFVMVIWQMIEWPQKMYSLGAVAYLLLVSANKLITAQHSSQFNFVSNLLKIAMVVGVFTVFFV